MLREANYRGLIAIASNFLSLASAQIETIEPPLRSMGIKRRERWRDPAEVSKLTLVCALKELKLAGGK